MRAVRAVVESRFEPQPGSVVAHYELVKPIAKGGMGHVWEARLSRDHGFQKTVALKLLHANQANPENQQMLFDEARLAARIQHANVASVVDFGDHQGAFYLVMEWVDGHPLDKILKLTSRTRGLPVAVALDIAIQTCRGLHAAHEVRDDDGVLLSVVHRDVSPQNILVRHDGIVKLIDFGVAKSRANSRKTAFGEVKGKVAYMSPEQVRGETVDRRTDVFAMGIVLYSMLTGRHPFRGQTPPETVHNICLGQLPRAPSSFHRDCPREIDDIVAKALERELSARFESADALCAALQSVVARLPRRRPKSREFMRALFIDAKKKPSLPPGKRERLASGANRRARVASARTARYVPSEAPHPSQSSLRGLEVPADDPSLPKTLAPPAPEPTATSVQRAPRPRNRFVPLVLTVVMGAAVLGGAALLEQRGASSSILQALRAGTGAIRTAVELVATK